ncbi:Uncharacterised protein [Halioglobus japonicus]|nr:Uncharacterised protein [Halioglobus japonicus]
MLQRKKVRTPDCDLCEVATDRKGNAILNALGRGRDDEHTKAVKIALNRQPGTRIVFAAHTPVNSSAASRWTRWWRRRCSEAKSLRRSVLRKTRNSIRKAISGVARF